MKRFWEIFSYAKKYSFHLYVAVLFNILNALLSLFTFASLVPLLRIIFQTYEETPQMPDADAGTSVGYWYELLCYKMDTFVQQNGELNALLMVCGITVTSSLIKNLVFYLSLRNIAVVRTGVSRDLRKVVYSRLLKLSLGYFSNERKGDIMSRMTNDLMEVEFSVLGTIEVMFKAPILIAAYLTTLFLISWKLTLFALVFMPISGWLISRIAKSLKNAAMRGKTKLGDLMTVIDETLGGIRIIKAFNGEKSFQSKFDQHNESYFQLMMKLYKREYLASPMSEFISITVIATLLYIGGSLILNPDGDYWMDGSVFIGYLMIFSQLIPPAKSLSDAIFKINKGAASVDRINEIIHAKIDVEEAENPVRKAEFTDRISLKDIHFSYGGDVVINGISLEIEKGKTIALVGPSGGGKSTLANLITRFYDIDSGAISVDGVPVKDISLFDLRELMGVVTQDSILFNDTIHNNITLGKDGAKTEDVIRAAQIANADEFIKDLPGKYDFNIGDGGTKLSGGQKQRLSIARAIYHNPPILILDEATSALDTHSEKLVQEAINNLMQNRTAVVIAHRLSTIKSADCIYVIKKGEIIEKGSHDGLIAEGGLYKSLVEMQDFS